MIVPWLAHLYTAFGAAAALLAALAVFDGDYRTAFIWLGAQIFIDATDGVLARALRVKERLPWFDGGLLDNLIDYVSYVFVPALIVVRAGLVPPASAAWIASAMLIASGYGFAHAHAKVQLTDHFFTGFPSYWNLVVFYMYVCGLSPLVNAAILLAFVVLVFVPLRYLYPSRTATLRIPTMVLGVSWGLIMIWMVWRLPLVDGVWLALSFVFPAYYFLLSLWLDFHSRR